MTDSAFKTRVRELRIEAYGTQEAFAYRGGVSRATVQNWESGKHIPNLAEAARLAELFGVSLDYLAGMTDEREPAPAAPRSDGRRRSPAPLAVDPLGPLAHSQREPARSAPRRRGAD